jgi:hypothetical protein
MKYLLVMVLSFSFTHACFSQSTEEQPSINQAAVAGEVKLITVLEQELQDLIKIYSQASTAEQIQNIRSTIRFSGITDTRLFDIAEKNMLERHTSKASVDTGYVAWVVQMLAFSGHEKYVPSIQKVIQESPAKNVRRHAQRSLEVRPSYKKWNQIISANLDTVPASGLKKARTINMLKSEDPELVRAAASIVDDFFLFDVVVTDIAEQRLLELYKKGETYGGEYAEASAWLCKVLGKSGNIKYKGILVTLSTSSSPNIARYAKRALKKM